MFYSHVSCNQHPNRQVRAHQHHLYTTQQNGNLAVSNKKGPVLHHAARAAPGDHTARLLMHPRPILESPAYL